VRRALGRSVKRDFQRACATVLVRNDLDVKEIVNFWPESFVARFLDCKD
jgi:hypothetical protein